MIKYVRYGNPKHGVPEFVITMFKTDHGNYKVEVRPCDNNGYAVSDLVAWDMFSSWWDAYRYLRKQYKDFYAYTSRNL